jgi:hypothetical protein
LNSLVSTLTRKRERAATLSAMTTSAPPCPPQVPARSSAAWKVSMGVEPACMAMGAAQVSPLACPPVSGARSATNS